MNDLIPMRPIETKWHHVLTLVHSRRLTGREAADTMRCTRRTVWRRLARFLSDGARGLVHRLRGRPGAHRTAPEVQAQALHLARTRYAGFNDSHLCEKLTEIHHLPMSRPTLRRWLRQAGIAPARPRRPPRHRRRRPRKPQAGLMILGDASPHAWLEDRGPSLTLTGFIDDATSRVVVAEFVPVEDTETYLRLFHTLARTHGLPHSAYVDRHSAFLTTRHRLTVEEELEGQARPTQVARALGELGITLIPAYSPQAKGRIERLWNTLQDRLVSELRLAGAHTLAEANAVLRRVLPDHNRRFAVPPTDVQPAWRPAPARSELDRICAWAYPAVVGNDNCVRLLRQVVQIPPGPSRRSYAQARVEVRILLDGRWQVWYHGTKLLDRLVASMATLRPHLHTRDHWQATGRRPGQREAA